MENQTSNLRILFTSKANSALDDIIESFGLEESEEKFAEKNKQGKLSNIVVIDHLAKDFAIGAISEKDLIDSLKIDLEVSQQKAEQISKEIITRIVPFLEKVPEEKFKDPDFVDDLANRIFGQTAREPMMESRFKEDFDFSSKTKPIESITKPTGEEPKVPEETIKRIRKPIVPKTDESPVPKPKRSRGPDNYREPI